MKVDFGGTNKGGEFITVNLDGAGVGHPAPDIVADITNEAEQLDVHFGAHSIDEARCIGTLEHLVPWDVAATLAHWRYLMKPNARLLITVPDLCAISHAYVAGQFDGVVFAGMIYGPADWQKRTPWEVHRWGWDESGLTIALERAGFHDVRRVPEPEPGFEVGGHRVVMLAMEAFA